MARRLRRGVLLALIGLGAAGAGCSGVIEQTFVESTPSGSTAAPSKIATEKLVGKWGIASYREEKDRGRVEAQAKAQCKQPYVIAKGPTDGVMMHAADDAALHELKLKGGPGGKTYLGFEAPPGDWQDREILTFTDKLFIARFVDPEINSRYGTFIYVRC